MATDLGRAETLLSEVEKCFTDEGLVKALTAIGYLLLDERKLARGK